jgi:hypothetical protein
MIICLFLFSLLAVLAVRADRQYHKHMTDGQLQPLVDARAMALLSGSSFLYGLAGGVLLATMLIALV